MESSSEDYILLHDFPIWTETNTLPISIVNNQGFLSLKYADSEITQPILSAPAITADKYVTYTLVTTPIDANHFRARGYAWFDLHAYIEEIVETGKKSPHRIDLCDAVRMRHARTVNVPDIIRVLKNNRTVGLEARLFSKLCERPLVAAEARFDQALFKTTPWSVQRYFLSRALSLDSEGTTFEYYPENLTRLANPRGDVLFVDSMQRRVLHASEVAPPMQHTLIGGFLIDSVGLGKTFSMLSLCAVNSPPEGYGLDPVTGERMRHTSGRVLSRATLIVCPAQVSAHWAQQIEQHLAQKYVVLNFAGKRDFEKYTMADLISCDFVIVTFNFTTNEIFKQGCDDYGSSGWQHFPQRAANALHDTKRRKTTDFLKETPISLAYVHFWRLVVDELHELPSHINRSTTHAIRALSARSLWGISASLITDAESYDLALKFQTHVHAPTVCHSKFSGNYDCIVKFSSLFVKSDPNTLNDIRLPGITEEIHWLTMSAAEMRIYRSLHHAEWAQIRCCCMPRLVSTEIPNIENCATVDEAMRLISTHMQAKLARAQESATHWMSTIERARAMIAIGTDARIMRANLVQAERQFDLHKKLVEDTERSLRFVQNTELELTGDCPICMDTLTNPVLLPCGHHFCQSCVDRIVGMAIESRKCPSCRTQLSSDTRLVAITENGASSTAVDSLVATHGTKVAAIIKFIRESTTLDPTEKFVIFSRIDSLLHEVGELLSTHMKVLYCRGSRDAKLNSIKRFEHEADCPVLLLSTRHSGSGVCLTMARNIVVLDVSNDSPSVITEAEKQITGRVYRPPQAREVRLHRFLMRDTIEETVYNKTLRHIDLRSVWNTGLQQN